MLKFILKYAIGIFYVMQLLMKKFMIMGAEVLVEKTDKKVLKVMKNTNKNKLVINTITPKFNYVNKKGELVKPKNEVSY